MKKTLIASVVATGLLSASGVANAAFESGYTGGDLSLGGTITTAAEGTVYEGKVGSVTGLDSTISVGDTSVSITAPANAGLLALRSVSGGFDSSASGKVASITFNGKTLIQAASGSSFSNGAIDMTLTAYNSDGDEIGTVTFPMQTAAVAVSVDNSTSAAVGASLYAPASSGAAYYGGLPQTSSGVISSYSSALSVIDGLFSDASEYLPDTTATTSAGPKTFTASGTQFYTAYAAGIVEGQSITLTLNSAATAGDVSWTASMPITVTYA
ncbi:TPA: hypothetical protein M2Q89_004920 [Escherichia coli]|nr:hypothetical protein [Escherichia coli]